MSEVLAEHHRERGVAVHPDCRQDDLAALMPPSRTARSMAAAARTIVRGGPARRSRAGRRPGRAGDRGRRGSLRAAAKKWSQPRTWSRSPATSKRVARGRPAGRRRRGRRRAPRGVENRGRAADDGSPGRRTRPARRREVREVRSVAGSWTVDGRRGARPRLEQFAPHCRSRMAASHRRRPRPPPGAGREDARGIVDPGMLRRQVSSPATRPVSRSRARRPLLGGAVGPARRGSHIQQRPHPSRREPAAGHDATPRRQLHGRSQPLEGSCADAARRWPAAGWAVAAMTAPGGLGALVHGAGAHGDGPRSSRCGGRSSTSTTRLWRRRSCRRTATSSGWPLCVPPSPRWRSGRTPRAWRPPARSWRSRGSRRRTARCAGWRTWRRTRRRHRPHPAAPVLGADAGVSPDLGRPALPAPRGR